MNRKAVRQLIVKGRKGIVIENGKFGIWFGLWFVTIDIVGGFHFELG